MKDFQPELFTKTSLTTNNNQLRLDIGQLIFLYKFDSSTPFSSFTFVIYYFFSHCYCRDQRDAQALYSPTYQGGHHYIFRSEIPTNLAQIKFNLKT